MSEIDDLEHLVDIFDHPHGILSRAKPLIRRTRGKRRPQPETDHLRAAERVEEDT